MKKKPQTVKKDTKRNDLDANQRFDHLFNIPLIGIGLYTVPDKRWIEVNDALCNLMGYSREEVMELTWIDLTHPDDIYDNARLFEDAVLGSGPKAYSLDKRFIRKDGSILHTTINVQSIREADGTPKYNVLFIQDVSEQKRAEQEILALKEKEQKQELSKYQQRLELALSSANFGTWVRQYDDDTVIWDSRTEAIFGFEPGAFEGTMDAVLDKIHPDDHEIVNAAYKQSVTSDTSYDIDYRIILTSGEIRHVASRAAVIKDEEGRPTQITGVLLDVTERKKTEEALRESEQLIQSFLQHTSSAITIKNQKGELLLCNPTYQQWLKAEGEDIKGKTLHEFLPPETAEAIARHDKKVFESGKPSSEERTNDFPDGVTRSLISHKFPIFHDDGDVHAIGTILTDLSERLRAEEAESANQTKSEFLASMSHEIRTPLNAILGFAQLMGTSESEPPTETQKVSLDQILSGGGHLLSLIDEILDLAKIESGDLSLVVEATDISSIIAECITSATQLGREEGLEIVNHTTGQTLPNVNIDTTRFRQVLLNLLSNAVKYNRPGGKVFVGFDHAGPDMVRIMVSDTGPGILPERQKDMFVPFSRLGRESSDVAGTGIGLTICKKLVEAMNGRIGFESRPGQGSTFWFEVPVAENQPHSRANNQPTTGPREFLGKHTILYVEDNSSNLKLMEALIGQRTDATMLSAGTGELGLEMAKEHLPNLILMDINLPGLNGFEALGTLKSFHTTAKIPVIALTARAMPDDVERGLRAGFKAYLTKPINIDQVLEAIESALS